MAENESTKWLYNKLNAMGYKVGETQEVFDNLMKTNEQSRKWAYEKARERGLNVGGYEEFSKLFCQFYNTNAHINQLAEKLQIQGTPAFVVGDQLFRGYIDANQMRNAIQQSR